MKNVPNGSNAPNDPIDPYELELSRRVGAFSEQAVQPINAVEVAATAIGARRRTGAGRLLSSTPPGRRIAWIGAGAVLVAALGVFIGVGGLSKLTPTQTAGAPGVATGSVCDSSVLTGRIVGWDGAAGNRIATVEMSNPTATACRLWDYQLALVDGGGRGQGLIESTEVHPGIALASGATVHTLMNVSNYCGDAVPVEPVSIRLDNTRDGGGDLVLTAVGGDLSGVPPCNGAPGSAGSISQQPWAPGPAYAR